MVRTQTAVGTIEWTELKIPTTLISNELLIGIIYLARLELDRCCDGYAIEVLRLPIAHDGETQRWISRRADGTSNCSESLINGSFIAFGHSNKIVEITVSAAATV